MFTVQRHEPELIIPDKPTPREVKTLSDIDSQKSLRMHVSGIFFYHTDPKMGNQNPAIVIKEALAKVLVFYYPFAGRLKEDEMGKLMVDCTSEGVLFIEAEADVTLKQLGDVIHPPFTYTEKFLYDVPGSSGVFDSPLLLIQVTRLLCGGFIVVVRHNHTMSDAVGLIQFMIALGEMIKGASKPTMLPVWQRGVLSARDPPRVTCTHHEYDDQPATVDEIMGKILLSSDMIQQSFFFGPQEISAIRRFVPTHFQNRSTFEVLTACLWRCRTIALQPNPEQEMRMTCPVNARKFKSFIPPGYYGNAIASLVAISSARDLCNKPLGYALELIINAKSNVTEEYIRSSADLIVIKGRPSFSFFEGSYFISDVTRLGFDELDLGWGKPVYGGPINVCTQFSSVYTRSNNQKGESGIAVTLSFRSVEMDRFVKELNSMLV
ncbi:benzyl alcohol O-benzoyltransferase-like [Rutidosis leptorrhynchoides]|uniref:benzyl alcohol O-benzoyltransferase-like n=1 Tax=Rutidosis leptorrhynchoides TaxID=125765 RepID=UPI003A998751